MKKALILFTLSLTVSSCTLVKVKDSPRTQVDFQQSNCSFEKMTGCKEGVFYKSQDGYKTLAILEIDDQGQFVNEEAAQNIIEMIRQKNLSENKPIVSLFVHGWNHNGLESDSNLKSFAHATETLLTYQDAYRTNKKEELREVIGIYVAWRGRVYKSNLNLITFWNRKKVSEEVGKGDLTRFIIMLEKELKSSKDNKENGTLILSGHSFGASALFNAINPILINRFYEAVYSKDQPIQGVGDIVVLLNPAIEATRFAPLREAVWREAAKNPNIFDKNLKPFFIVMGSGTDKDTSTFFPIGRRLNAITEHYKTIDIVDGNSSKVRKISEKSMDITAIGNFSPFYTHWAVLMKGYYNREISYDDCYISQNKNWFSIAQNSYNGENWSTETPQKIDLLPIRISTQFVNSYYWDKNEPRKTTEAEATTWKKNPYWFVRASDNIVKEHNGIWNKNIGCFVLSMLITDENKSTGVTINQPK